VIQRSKLQVVLAFVERINAHDLKGMLALITPDHRLLDALGESVRGLQNVRRAWKGYFAMVPDYEIVPDEVIAEGHTVALFGKAHGTFCSNGELRPEDRWEIPFAARALVRGQRVATWQIYCDNAPIRRIIRARSGVQAGEFQ